MPCQRKKPRRGRDLLCCHLTTITSSQIDRSIQLDAMADADGRAMNGWRKSTYSHANGGQRFLCWSLENGVLVAVRVPLEDHELGLEEVRETLVHALAAAAGLREAADADAEGGPPR